MTSIILLAMMLFTGRFFNLDLISRLLLILVRPLPIAGQGFFTTEINPSWRYFNLPEEKFRA